MFKYVFSFTYLGFSAHVCVVMNGHFVNPSWLSSSLIRSERIIDLKYGSVLYKKVPFKKSFLRRICCTLFPLVILGIVVQIPFVLSLELSQLVHAQDSSPVHNKNHVHAYFKIYHNFYLNDIHFLRKNNF